MKRRLLSAAVATCVAILAGPAAAAMAKTVLVSTSGTDAALCGTSAANACATIGGALNPADGGATDGDTVSVGAGTYTEQVTITKGITLDGAGTGQTTIKAASHPLAQCASLTDSDGQKIEPMICVDQASGPVTIENLTVDASAPSGTDGGCLDDPEDIYSQNTAVTIQNTVDENAQYQPTSDNGCQGGLGIDVANTDSASRAAVISNNTVNSYAKNGITVVGAGLSYTITGNTVTALPTDLVAPNGIEVGEAGSGTISNNTVSGQECLETSGGCNNPNPITGVQSGGILLFNLGTVTVSGNTVSGSDVGIYTVDCSTADGCTYSGTPTTYDITGNTLTNNRYEGLYAGAGNTTASGNTITGSAIGVENASFNGPPADPGNAVLNLTGNSITGNGTALEDDVDNTSGTNHPVTTAHDNNLSNNTNGIVNNTSQPIDASDNTLTCSAGSGAACVGGTGSGKVTFSSLKLVIAAAKSSIGVDGQTDTITAALVDSAGHVVSGAAVPNGTTIGFASSLGTVPATATTTSGVATVTLTSGTTSGSAVVAAGFDGQAATTSVLVGSVAAPPPTTQVTGAVVVSGGTLRESKGVVTFSVVNPQSTRISATLTLTAKIGKHTVTIAKRTVSIAAHRRVSVGISLSKAARRALKKKNSHLNVKLTTLVSGVRSSSSFKLTS